MAARDPPKPFDRAAAIEQWYADIDLAKELAFDRKAENGDRMPPDLQALPKILELQAKVFGLLTVDGKRAPGSDAVPVPLEEVEKLVKAAKLRLREKKNDETE